MVRELVKQLNNQYVRDSAAKALGRLAQNSEDVCLQLLKTLQDGRFNVRVGVLTALSTTGRQTDDVMAALNTALKDNNIFVRKAAAESLKQIRGTT